MVEYMARFSSSMDTISSLFTTSLDSISSIDPEIAMAILVIVVVSSTALTLSILRQEEAPTTNDVVHQEQSSAPPADHLNDSFGPEGMETYCGSFGSEASTCERSFAAQDDEEIKSSFIPIEVMTDAPYYDETEESSPKQRRLLRKTSSFSKIITKLKNKQAARKEASILKQSRAAVMKKLQRKSFSDHFRSLNPLTKLGRKNKHLLTKSKSLTFAPSSVMDDQSYTEKSV
jgi:hypothetical protein